MSGNVIERFGRRAGWARSSRKERQPAEERFEAPRARPEQRRGALVDTPGLSFECPHCCARVVIEALQVQGMELACEKVVALAPEDTGKEIRIPIETNGLGLAELVEETELRLALHAFRAAHGVQAEAARLLGLKYTTYCDMVRRAMQKVAGGAGVVETAAPAAAPEAVVIELVDGDAAQEVRIDLAAADGALFPTVSRELRERLMRDALERANGNIAAAARLAGMNYTTFYETVRRLGIERKAPSGSARGPWSSVTGKR